jgi:hypothetical protein
MAAWTNCPPLKVDAVVTVELIGAPGEPSGSNPELLRGPVVVSQATSPKVAMAERADKRFIRRAK